MQPLIVVVGATGNQGKSVVNALIRSNKWTVRGLTRNVSSNASQELIKQGVEMVSCNIDSVDECSAAFKGAYGIFAMTNYWECGPEKEYQQGLNMVNAAREQNVQHFIWSSLPDTVALSNGKLNLRHYMMKARVQSYIRSLDNPRCFPYITFVYIGFYYQNFETFFQPTKNFEFLLPLEETARLPLYDVRDTGNVVAQCFEHPERWGQSNIVPIVAQCLTMNEICEIMRRTTGNNQIRFIPLTYDQCSDKTEEFLDNMRWYNEYGNYEDRQEDKTKEVYNHMVTLEQWLKESKWLQQ